MPFYEEKDNDKIAAEAKIAAKKAIEEVAAKKAAAAQNAINEAAAQNAINEAAVQKAAEEAVAQKAAEEAVTKAAEEAAAILKAAEDAAAAQKIAAAAAAQRAAEELAAQNAINEAAILKAAEDAAAAQKIAAAAAQRATIQKKFIEAVQKTIAAQKIIAAQKTAEEAIEEAAAQGTAQKTTRGEYINVEAYVSKEDAMQLLSCVLHIPDGTPIKNDNNTYIEIKNNFTNKDANANAHQDLYNLKSSFNDDIFDSLKTTTIKFNYTSNTYIFLKACYNTLTQDNSNIETNYYLDIVCELAQAIQDAVKAAIIERLTSLYNIIICFTTLNPQILLNNIIIYTDTQKNNKLNLNSLSIICSNTSDVSWSSNEEYGIDLQIMNNTIDNINEHVQKKRELLTEIAELYLKLFWPLNSITDTDNPINVDMANSVRNVYYNDTLDDNKTRGIDTLMKYPLSLLTLSKVLNEVSALFTRHALQLASDKIKSNILEPQKTNTFNKYFNITDILEKAKFDTAVQAIDTFTPQEKTETDHISLVSLKVQFNNMYYMLNTRELNTLMKLPKQYIDLDNALQNVTFEHMIHDDILKCPQILSAITEATFVIIKANITTGNVKKMVNDIDVLAPKLSGFVQVQESLKKGGFRKTKYKKYTKKINKSIRQISGKYTKIIGGFRNTHTKQYTKKKYKKAKNIKQLIHNKS